MHMPRTTVRIDDPVMKDLKRLQRKLKQPLGRLVSELLAEAISRRQNAQSEPEPPFNWIAKPMGFKVDLEDKQALQEMMDREDFPELFK